MTDEELAAIEARAKDQDRLGSIAQPATVLALVAEVRRLRVELDEVTAVLEHGSDPLDIPAAGLRNVRRYVARPE